MKYATVIGSLNYDIFLALKHIPKLGETAVASSVKTGAGGKGANQAVQLAKLSYPVYMAGAVGDDQMGKALRTSLEEAGVQMDCLCTVQGQPTGMGVVDTLPDGSVMAVISRGANDFCTTEWVRQLKERIKESQLLILQLEIPVETVEEAIRIAKENGVKVLLNAAPACPLMESVIKACDYFVVNEVEASFYLGEAVDSLEIAEKLLKKKSQQYGNCWICTLGSEGAVISTEGKIAHIPAVKGPVVETTGAGDSFVGGFCYGLLCGMDEFSAAEFAARCSAITIRSVGAQDSMPTRERILEEFGI